MTLGLDFHWVDDETCRVFLAGTEVITMEHGPHGWDGMEGIQEALLSAARIAGWQVKVFGEPGI